MSSSKKQQDINNTHDMKQNNYLCYDNGYGNYGHAINIDKWSGYDSGCWGRPFDAKGIPTTLQELFKTNTHDGGKSFWTSGGTKKWKYVGLSGATAHGAEYLIRYYETDPNESEDDDDDDIDCFAVFKIETDQRVTLVHCHAKGFVPPSP